MYEDDNANPQAYVVRACSHVWIDPTDAPIERAPYSPVVGTARRQMKPGGTYVCRECKRQLTVNR